MKAPRRHPADRSGRSSKGFLFLVLLGMFFVVFVLPKMNKSTKPAPAGPGGGIVDAPPTPGGGSILPAPGNRGGGINGGTAQNGDWSLEEVDIGGTKPASRSVDVDNFGKGGTIKLPGPTSGGLPEIRIDGRTPGFNPNPGGIDTTVDIPGAPDKTEKGDWSIEEVETTKPSSGVTIEPIKRTKPGQKSTKGDWSIETK